jgi:transposase
MFIMVSMGKKKPQRARRVFPPEFKAEIVGMCLRGERSIPQVVHDFELTDSAVRNWIKQAQIDAGTRTDGPTSGELDEIAALKAENRRLREDVEILKRATAFFVNETR